MHGKTPFRLLGAVIVAALLFGCLAAAQDFTYIANPPRVEVSPQTVLPSAIPFCNTSIGTLICYSPRFLRSAYNFPSNLDGHGQTIVIVDAFGSPTIQQDLHRFDQLFGIPDPPSFQVVCPDGCPTFNPNNAPLAQISWTIETTLDVEYAHAMAPGANLVLVVASSPAGNSINVAEAFAIANFPGSIMSQSFGIPEFAVRGNNAQLLQASRNYAAARAAGITVLAAAGDFGATNGASFANALFPSSHPLVTAVGGTQGHPYPTGLASCSLGPPQVCTGAYGGEEVWNEPHFGAAGGGAPSLLFGVPSYQAGLGLSRRTTPDVSYNAAVNGGVLVFYSALGSGGFFIVGGTSAGSPQWAAVVALANQQAGHSLGFLNPTLYRIGCSANAGIDYHDITIGNNQLVGTPVGFSAVTGWDDATGWGTPNVANLVLDLASPPSCP